MKKLSLVACIIYALLIGTVMGYLVPRSMAAGACDVTGPGGSHGMAFDASRSRIFLQLDSPYKIVSITKLNPSNVTIKIAKR